MNRWLDRDNRAGRVSRRLSFNKLGALALIGLAVAIGSIVLLTRASGHYIAREPELGRAVGRVMVKSDPNASGRSYVQFGAAPAAPLLDTVSILGTMPKPINVYTRDGAINGLVGNQILWMFGDNIYITTEHFAYPTDDMRTSTSAYSTLSRPLELIENVNSYNTPIQLLPFNQSELDFNRANWAANSTRIALWPTGMITLDDGSGLIFYLKLTIKPGLYNYVNMGVGTAILQPGAKVAVRTAGLVFNVPGRTFSHPLRVGNTIYLYDCPQENAIEGQCLLAKAPVASASQFGAYTYWNGQTWVADRAQAVAIFSGAPAGQNVKWSDYLQKYVTTYVGVFTDNIYARYATKPEGPWSDPQLLYTVTESHDAAIYNAEVHPEVQLGQKDLVFSYYVPKPNFTGELRTLKVTYK